MSVIRGDWFFIVLIFIDSIVMARPYIYCIQQDNYRLGELFKSKRMRTVVFFDIIAITIFLSIWSLFYFLHARPFWAFLTVMFFFIAEFAMYFIEDLPDKKKPLRYTKRVVRALFFVSVGVTAILGVFITMFDFKVEDSFMRYLVLLAFPLVYPALFVSIMLVVNVFERLNNMRYEHNTSQILSKNKSLIKIGITGSFGKTSVKNILEKMLSSDFNVLVTPSSYNTPMGIAKTVKQLDATHEIFIAEMGARRVGDIKRLMKIVKPTHSILTGINNQHLETFKTEDNIAREKMQIVAMLDSAEGFSVATDKQRARFNGMLNAKHPFRIPIFAGFDDFSDVIVADFAVSPSGSVFTLVLDDRPYSVETPLLGAHNAENIALASAMAFGLGVSVAHIIEAIAELSPTPHRMQLIEGKGIKIIDDSFNSNPDGARASLAALSMFPNRKVVMTPGLVELGKHENEENFRLGQEISAVADECILIGKRRTEFIRQGLKDCNFQGEVRCYGALKDAENDFPNILHLDDILLILNDLPDVYDE